MNLKNLARFIVLFFALKASADVQEKVVDGRKIVEFYFTPLSVLVHETKQLFPKIEMLEKLKLQERNLDFIQAEVQKGLALIQPTLAQRERDITFLEGEVAFLKARAEARSDFSRISYLLLARRMSQEHDLIAEHLVSLREVNDPITEEIAFLKSLAKEYIHEIGASKDASLKATLIKDLYNKYVDKFMDLLVAKVRMINEALVPLTRSVKDNTEIDLTIGLLNAENCAHALPQLQEANRGHAATMTYDRDTMVALISGRPNSTKTLKIVCEDLRNDKNGPYYNYNAHENVIVLKWAPPYFPSLRQAAEVLKTASP